MGVMNFKSKRKINHCEFFWKIKSSVKILENSLKRVGQSFVKIVQKCAGRILLRVFETHRMILYLKCIMLLFCFARVRNCLQKSDEIYLNMKL